MVYIIVAAIFGVFGWCLAAIAGRADDRNGVPRG